MKTPRPFTAAALFVFIGLLATGLRSAAAEGGVQVQTGAGEFDFQRAGKTVPVWYFLPRNAGPKAPIVVVMHGVKRDGKRYRDDWQGLAERYGFVLVAPEFSEAAFPKVDAYNYGGMMDGKGRPLPREEGSFSFIEPIFRAVKEATKNGNERFYLYGHSAGAQFVHRYMLFMPQAPVAAAVAANAGWWTMPDPAIDFPYGVRGSPLDEAGLKSALQRPMTVLLGTLDTDPNHPELRKTPEAEAQGPHRWARGHRFFEEGQRRAAALGVPLGWNLAVAPGVGHQDAGMATFAARLLFGK